MQSYDKLNLVKSPAQQDQYLTIIRKERTRMNNAYFTIIMLRFKSADSNGSDLPARSAPVYI